MKRVVIVGGGISGLATAHSLMKLASEGNVPLDCTVVEQARSFGGKIVTNRQDGFVIEGGPDSFLAQKPRILALCDELGLTERLIRTSPTRGVSVLHRGRLIPLPEGLLLVAPTKLLPFARSPLFSWPGKLRMGLDVVIPPRRSDDDESVADFIRRRLGREALDRLAQPLMAGIHVADPERLSMQAAFPRLVAIERQHGSLIRGLGARAVPPSPRPDKPDRGNHGGPGFLSLKGGMGELAETLTARLGPALLLAGRPVAYVGAGRPAPGHPDAHDLPPYGVGLEDGTVLRADAVVLATPANVSANLVDALSPVLAAALRRIRYVSTATVSLGFRRRDVAWPATDSGFVVPRREGCAITACTWSSSKFDGRAPDGHVLLRAFVGGAEKERLVDLDEQTLVGTVRADLRRVLGIVAEPVVVDVFRWRGAIPQYDVGHLARVAAIERTLTPGLFLAGAAYHGVGVPDCVATAHETAERVARYLTDVEVPDLARRA